MDLLPKTENVKKHSNDESKLSTYIPMQ